MSTLKVNDITDAAGTGAPTFSNGIEGTLMADLITDQAGTGGPQFPNDILGLTAPSAAATGYVGEYIATSAGYAATLCGSTVVYKAVFAISLDPGDWDVGGTGHVTGLTNTTVTGMSVVFGTATDTSTGSIEGLSNITINDLEKRTTGGSMTLTVPPHQWLLAATTTVYVNVWSQYTGGTCKMGGSFVARRWR